MPLKLNVGISRKIGLPQYSSAGASCNIEVELANDLLQHDPDAFQTQVREAFAAAQQAVDDQLTTLSAEAPTVLPAAQNGNGHPRGQALHREGPPARTNGAGREQSARPCTLNQVRAIRTIARNLGFDLEQMLRADYGVELPSELNLAQASRLIDTLKAASES